MGLHHWNARWYSRSLYLDVALFIIGTYGTFSFCDILFDSDDVSVTSDSWSIIIRLIVYFFFLLEDFWRYRHWSGAKISWGLQRFHRLFLLCLSLSRIVNFLNVISHFGWFIELFSDNRIAIIVKYFLGFQSVWCSRYHRLSQSSWNLIVLVILLGFPLFHHSFRDRAFGV